MHVGHKHITQWCYELQAGREEKRKAERGIKRMRDWGAKEREGEREGEGERGTKGCKERKDEHRGRARLENGA